MRLKEFNNDIFFWFEKMGSVRRCSFCFLNEKKGEREREEMLGGGAVLKKRTEGRRNVKEGREGSRKT